MRILVSGGGSAGHITPILATLDALKAHDKSLKVLYVGQKGSMEERIARSAGYEFAVIQAGKFRRFAGRRLIEKLRDLPMVALNLRDLTRVVRGFGVSRRIIKQFEPDIIFIKGGYVGLPVGLAAWSLHLPFVIHESDMRPGVTNRTLAKYAAKVAVGFPVALYKGWQSNKLVYTGNPVRRELLTAHRLEGLSKFKLSSDLPVILVVCGSQGAQAINAVILDALPELISHYQIIHVAGERNIEAVRFQVSRLAFDHAERYQLHSFLTDTMAEALAAADLVIGRGGANTFSELATLSKPAIIIPHPGLTDQVLNATTLARSGAIKVLPQERLNASSLARQIDQILGSETEQAALAKAIKEYALPDADENLARLLLENTIVRTKTEQEDVSDGN